MSPDNQAVEINGRRYKWPSAPVVVVCIDGSEPDYIEKAVAAGKMPYTAEMLKKGADLRADCVIPSFTNPNNLSIVTGAPPAVHGICGNFFYDMEADSEVMMNEPRFLRASTIFAKFHEAGAKVAVVTAKDKLRRLLGDGLDYSRGRAICFSSEKANETTMAENGIDNAQAFVGRDIPSVYSADLSEFIFDAGVKLMAAERPDLMYLSTTDYVQHKHAPGTEAANSFYAMMDSYWQKLDEMGAIVALTADHGMTAMHDAEGDPDVIYLQDVMDQFLAGGKARVILPITDPYVVHHGALGGFATIYLPDGADCDQVCRQLEAVPGIDEALPKTQGCQRFSLPEDRVGDVIVIAGAHKALGSTPAKHDLSGLTEPLRSHGGVTTQRVPLLVNRPVSGLAPDHSLRNFDIFAVALNHAA